MWKQRGFFDHRSYIEKITWKQRGFFDHRITSKKVPENNVDFLTIEITSKKVHGDNVDFSTIHITSKKYVETAWIFRPSKLHRKGKWKQREFFDHRTYIEKGT